MSNSGQALFITATDHVPLGKAEDQARRKSIFFINVAFAIVDPKSDGNSETPVLSFL